PDGPAAVPGALARRDPRPRPIERAPRAGEAPARRPARRADHLPEVPGEGSRPALRLGGDAGRRSRPVRARRADPRAAVRPARPGLQVGEAAALAGGVRGAGRRRLGRGPRGGPGPQRSAPRGPGTGRGRHPGRRSPAGRGRCELSRRTRGPRPPHGHPRRPQVPSRPPPGRASAGPARGRARLLRPCAGAGRADRRGGDPRHGLGGDRGREPPDRAGAEARRRGESAPGASPAGVARPGRAGRRRAGPTPDDRSHQAGRPADDRRPDAGDRRAGTGPRAGRPEPRGRVGKGPARPRLVPPQPGLDLADRRPDGPVGALPGQGVRPRRGDACRPPRRRRAGGLDGPDPDQPGQRAGLAGPPGPGRGRLREGRRPARPRDRRPAGSPLARGRPLRPGRQSRQPAGRDGARRPGRRALHDGDRADRPPAPRRSGIVPPAPD
ncbi:hypothetical protein HK102_011622, partial [Quaeritorhiza haematococci]